MKRIVCLTLVFVLCFCLCSCGKTDNTDSYKLPTADEFVDGYKSLFTLSDIRKENGKIVFTTSTGEEVIGYINDSGKVNKISVYSEGEDPLTMVQEEYRYYLVGQYLSIVMDENVDDDVDALANAVEILEVLYEAEPTTEETETSKTMTWNNKKDGVEYELRVCQYPSLGYGTMELEVEIH